ncbi:MULTISPECIES: amino acid ABC transporter permease [unclassified Herbaspirillum]|uniref:amino acid ABC transporter permease n=1 Tax=unclassified Herbaspirillum TaxID=2624150 RepID=UPI00383BB59F
MTLDFGIVSDNISYIANGFAFTLQLTAVATVIGMLLGLMLALARESKVRLVARCASTYVIAMRSIPLILVLFWIFFLMPLALQFLLGAGAPVKVDGKQTAMVTFSLFESAYFCEIVRSGIRSVSAGQRSAAFALGLNPVQTMGYVILPQGLRNMLPIFLTQIIVLFQDTSLVYVISVTDFMGAAAKIGERDGSLIEPYLFVAAIYLVISVAIAESAVRLFRKKTARV